jgi:hypothetical protein
MSIDYILCETALKQIIFKPSDIARITGKTRASIYCKLRRWEKKGLVKRVEFGYILTDKGVRICREIKEIVESWEKETEFTIKTSHTPHMLAHA